ncbi:MAG: glycosyltransferase family 2 protein [Gaiellales bacterium]
MANDAILLLLVALNIAATGVIVTAARQDGRERSRQELVDIATIARSELTTALSVIVPAHDDVDVIVPAVHALLGAAYPTLEVIVVDDGSQDGTIEALRQAFSLVQVDRVPRTRLRAGRVTAAYASPLDARLLVLDKAAAGRADSLNTGLRFARYPLVCPIDPRLTLDRDALVLLAGPFQANPQTIVCAASTRTSLARTATSLVARVAAARFGGPLLARGAIAMLSREIVVSAGGFDSTAAREELELVRRLHRHARGGGLPDRIVSLTRSVGSSSTRGMPAALVRRPLALVIIACAIAGLVLAPLTASIDVVLLASASGALWLAALLLEPTRRIGPERRCSQPLGDPGATLIG